MLDWRALALLSDDQLGKHDIAEVNLACAADLPDSSDLDVPLCLHLLDRWADYTRRFTEKAYPDFVRQPEAFNHSPGFFRALCLITALQRDLGAHYNEAKMSEDIPLVTADTFVHGVLLGEGGTCSSLPVVYIAVGRRLGYPMKLVATDTTRVGHLFARWESDEETFNIEAVSKGLRCPSDDYYRSGHYPISAQDEKAGCFLQSQTPRQELSGFLMERGFRWLDYQNYRQAANAHAWGYALDSSNILKYNRLITTLNTWGNHLRALEPLGFPDMYYRWPPRRFPWPFPLDLEKDILSLEAWENVLTDPEFDQKWWEPLRQGRRAYPPPIAIDVELTASHCHIRFRFSSDPPLQPLRKGDSHV